MRQMRKGRSERPGHRLQLRPARGSLNEGNRDRTQGFGQGPAARLRQQRQVAVDRPCQPESVLQLDLPWRAREKVRASHHACDSLPCVVDDHRELVARDAVTSFDDGIS